LFEDLVEESLAGDTFANGRREQAQAQETFEFQRPLK
jgi:hypothetical protein